MRLAKTLTSPCIDWEGNCHFVNGKVDSFKTASTRNNFGMVPIPNDEEILRDARQAARTLAGVMKPATREQIALSIKRLSLHCGMQAKAPEEVRYMFADYCRDLADYPAAMIEEACAKYRQRPGGNSFLPASGVLIEIMAPKMRKVALLQSRINKILGIEAPSKKQAAPGMASLKGLLDSLL